MRSKVYFIAIDGYGGSGKSTLAENLSKVLNAEIIHTDDFASFDNWSNWWPLVIDSAFDPIKSGAKQLNYPRSKWWEDHYPEPIVNQPVTKIMILEGVSSLRKEFREYIDFGVYVSTPKEVCMQRGLERDRGNDGKSDEEIIQLWIMWLENEDTYIARDNPKEYADIIVDGTRSIDESIKKIRELLIK